MNKQLDLFGDINSPDVTNVVYTASDRTVRTLSIHERENNRESENNLNENRKHFTKQAQDVFNALMNGGILTADSARERFGVRHLPRRLADIREAGFAMSDEIIPNSHGMKKTYMTPTQIYQNKQLLTP